MAETYNHIGVGYHIRQRGKTHTPKVDGVDRVEEMLRLYDEGNKEGLLTMAELLHKQGHHTAAAVVKKKAEMI